MLSAPLNYDRLVGHVVVESNWPGLSQFLLGDDLAHLASLDAPYLDVIVAPGEEGHDGQAADDDDLQDEDGRPHDPVECHDAGAVVHAHVATLRAGQALESAFLVVQALHVLGKRDDGGGEKQVT